MAAKSQLFLGTSGYVYNHWANGVFYPPKLPQTKWFQHYCRFFNSVEINFTFYRLPEEATFRGWHNASPENFHFVIKGSRFITHIKRLNDCREPLRVYFSKARILREKLSLVLWQLPPFFKKDLPRLKSFLAELDRYSFCRHCFEFRNATWFDDEVFKTLSAENVCLCMAHPTSSPQTVPETASFVYLRRHGEKGQGYTSAFLKSDSRKIRDWMAAGKDVYVYFNNDAKGFAIRNAFELKRLLGLPEIFSG